MTGDFAFRILQRKGNLTLLFLSTTSHAKLAEALAIQEKIPNPLFYHLALAGLPPGMGKR